MDIFEQAKNRISILDVCNLLGIKLNRNYKCLCPFHKEKTPSFSIHPDKNIFCCFGCGRSRRLYYFSIRIIKYETF